MGSVTQQQMKTVAHAEQTVGVKRARHVRTIPAWLSVYVVTRSVIR